MPDMNRNDVKRVDFPNGNYAFMGLSTADKPDERDFDENIWGSTFYEVDTSKLYIMWDGNWIEQAGD